jgi:hypothetical protein
MMFGSRGRKNKQNSQRDSSTSSKAKRASIFNLWRDCSASMRELRHRPNQAESEWRNEREKRLGTMSLPEEDDADDRGNRQYNKDIIRNPSGGAKGEGDNIASGESRYECDHVNKEDIAALVWLSKLIESETERMRSHTLFASRTHRHRPVPRPVTGAPFQLSALQHDLFNRRRSGQLGARIAHLMDHVTTLDLTAHQLDRFPEEVLRLTSLRNLCLADNRIESVPPAIERLDQLERLVLRNNRLTSLPLEMGNLGSLRELCVCANFIAHVPTAVGQLYRLPELRPLSCKVQIKAQCI